MAEIMIQSVKVTDDDVILDDYTPDGEYNPHNIHPFLLHDHGFCVAVVFANNLQDALDIAVDNDKMDSFLIQKEDYGDYGMNAGIYDEDPRCSFLGIASEPFDIETLQVIELENPPMSFCALYKANQEQS